jgi:hypothetical protein
MGKLASSVYGLVITDARMESGNAGFEVVRAARRQAYNPATALLTAYPPPSGDWKPKLLAQNACREHVAADAAAATAGTPRCQIVSAERGGIPE